MNRLRSIESSRELAATVAVFLALTSHTALGQRWTHDTFEDFATGRLDQAGQNLYVGRDGSIRVIHRFDLNQDGYVDLIFNDTHDTSSLHPAAMVRVAPDEALEISELAVPGSIRAAVGDFNKDGLTDLAFCPNATGIQDPRQMVTILWGCREGWSAHRSYRLLPVNAALDVAVADLNCDSWLDIVVLCRNEQSRHGLEAAQTILRVYWGSDAG